MPAYSCANPKLEKAGVARPLIVPKYSDVGLDIITNLIRTAGVTREAFSRFLRIVRARMSRIASYGVTDGIPLMAGGRIVESGSHSDLLARGGKYAESWALQVEA